jgi:hypothetical protein
VALRDASARPERFALISQAAGALNTTRWPGQPLVCPQHGAGVRRPACRRASHLANGAWRVHPVARDETHAAGATRCGAPRFHL